MAFPDVLRKRQIKKLSVQFAALVSRGEIGAALAFYESELSAVEIELDKAVRVLYLFHRWMERRDDEDLHILETLATNEADESPIARAAHCLRRFRRESNLAAAVSRRNAACLNAPSEPTNSPLSSDLENLALAILELYHPSSNTAGHRQTALAIQRLLTPSMRLEGKTREVRDFLLVWSSWILGEYARLVQDLDYQRILQGGAYQRFQLAAFSAHIYAELLYEHPASAKQAFLKRLIPQVSREQATAASLSIGYRVLGIGKTESAIAWFSSAELAQIANTVPNGKPLQALALSQAYFSAGRYTSGRSVLAWVLKQDTGASLASQARYLLGLSLLAETRDWATPQQIGEQEVAEEQRVHNRTLWRDLHSHLDQIVSELVQSSEEFAWRGYLLAGLVAFLDTNTTLSAELVSQFSQAIEYFGDQVGRTRLKTLEGILLTRSRAAEEATSYIKQGETAKLRVLQDQVLAPLGDAVPPIVRAAVYMTLWQAELDYDPLPDLQRIPSTPETDPSVTECIVQVQITQTLRQLATLCRQQRLRDDQALPTLTALARSKDMAWKGALASAVLCLRQHKWRASLDALSSEGEDIEEQWRDLSNQVQFYAAWQIGDAALHALPDCPTCLGRYPGARIALTARRLVAALETDDQVLAARLLRLPESMTQDLEDTIRQSTSLVHWFLRHRQPQSVLALVNLLRTQLESNGVTQSIADHVGRWNYYFTALATALMGQYTACAEACDNVLASSSEYETSHELMRETVRLLRLETGLALTVGVNADLGLQWPSIQRELLDQAGVLNGTPVLQAYGFLIVGLVSHLAADVLIGDEILYKLMTAQHTLPLAGGAEFVQNTIGRLDWRRRVIADFWEGLGHGDLKLSRAIYQREILPAFGDRVPHPIQLGMIIADWDMGQTNSAELLKHLTLLEYEAPELDPAVIQKARDYIHEGDQVRHFTKLIKDNDFDGIIEFIGRSPWAQGGIPVAVGIALLYAYYKKEHMEEAERLASVLSDDPKFPDWVRNYGYFIVGYVYHRKGDFPRAAETFGKIQQRTLLGHNTDRYWAVAHFADGLQKLKVDQKEDAFKAFRLSLSQRGAAQSNANLAPLFVHFGLKNIEARNGSQARQAFALMNDSLAGLEETPTVVQSRIVAQMGELVSRSLMDLTTAELPCGDTFLQLVAQLGKVEKALSSSENRRLQGALRRMAIAQELRCQCRLDNRHRKRKDVLARFLEEQSQALETIELQAAESPEGQDITLKHDPVLLVIQAMIALRLNETADLESGLEWLTQAMRLGLQSRQLADLIQRIGAKKKDAIDKRKAVLDLFDAYLLQGTVPTHLRDDLVRRDDLAELYRASRNYTPRDLAVIEVQSSSNIIERRVGHLVCNWIDGGTIANTRIQTACQELKELLKPDGRLAPEFAQLLNEIGVHLKQEKDDPSKFLGTLCAEVVQMKELEHSILRTELQLMQLLTQRFQRQIAHL